MSAITIQGLQEAQRRNLERIAAMQPSGGLGRMVQNIALAAHRYMTSIVHVDTGAYKASNRVDMRGLTATISVSPGAVNPKGQRPAIYSVGEEARGGSHAAYARTGAQLKGMAAAYTSAFGRSLV